MTRLTRLPLGRDQAVWLKAFGAGRGWSQARQAYDQVAPRWRAAGVPTPEVLACWPKRRRLLLSHLPGRPATNHDPAEVFAAAGRALRALHGLPCPDDDIPMAKALLRRAKAWAARPTAPAVAPRVVSLIAGHAGALGGKRVWCHRDYQPQNWIVGSQGAFGVLDFEHTRPDHPLVDWVRLEARAWSPAQRDAFRSTYGDPDPAALRCVLALYGLATVAWAKEHGDTPLLQVGQRALDRVAL